MTAQKKRRLSPSASSRASSATPAPAPAPGQSLVPSDSLSALPTEFPSEGLGLAGPGPSTLGQARQANEVKLERRAYARNGAIVHSSGDGPDAGEECFLWTDLPIVKNFRYAPCTLSPITSPHPKVPFYRTIPYPPPTPPVHISWLDRSAFIRLSPTALTMTNDRGFRSARANVSVREGSWFYEVHIVRGDGASGSAGGTGGDAGNAHVRIGWGRREATIDAPVGADGYSYAIRDVGGEKVHLSRLTTYGRSFKTGDIIGCMITLPPRPEPSDQDRSPDDPAVIKRHRRHFIYKNQPYFEMPEYTTCKEMDSLVDREGKGAAAKAAAAAAEAAGAGSTDHKGQENGGSHSSGPEMVNGGGKGKKGATTKNAKKGKKTEPQPVEPELRQLATLKGSSISFFLNGEPLGEAFTDLYDFTPLPPLHLLAAASKRHPTDRDGGEILHDDGTLGYYPMISCFGKGKARCEFGPEFAFPPAQPLASSEAQQRVRPMSARWEEFREEERLLDDRDEKEDTRKLLVVLEEERRLSALAARGEGGRKKKASTTAIKKKKGTGTGTGMGMGNTPTPTPAPESERFASISARGTPAPSDVDPDGKEDLHLDIGRESRERSMSMSNLSAANGAMATSHDHRLQPSIANEDDKVRDGQKSPTVTVHQDQEGHEPADPDDDLDDKDNAGGVKEEPDLDAMDGRNVNDDGRGGKVEAGSEDGEEGVEW